MRGRSPYIIVSETAVSFSVAAPLPQISPRRIPPPVPSSCLDSRSLEPMADQGVAGGGQGGDAVIGAGDDGGQLVGDRHAILAKFLRGKLSLSIIDDDSVVTLFLEQSGKVDLEELKVHSVPNGYENDDQDTMEKIVALLNLYQRMGVNRRKILFLRLVGLQGVRGVSRKDALSQETTLLKEYLHDKDTVSECYRKVKKVKACFLREPEVFDNLPQLKEKI